MSTPRLSRNLATRVTTTALIAIVCIIAWFTFDGYLLKLLILLGLTLTLLETSLAPALRYRRFGVVNEQTRHTVAIELATIAIALVGILSQPPAFTLLVTATAWLTDAAGYIVGHLVGGVFYRSRPFPNYSPNKTWEGVIGQLLTGGLVSTCIYGCVLGIPPDQLSALAGWFIGTAAIVTIYGDVFASKLKRLCRIKDSCETAQLQPALQPFEAILGGRHGHGGYLDRFDSLAFLAAATFVAQTLAGLPLF